MRRTHSLGTTSSSNPTSRAQLKNEAEETANAVKNVAKVIRDAAISTREAVKAFSDSGVAMELAESIQGQRWQLETQHKVSVLQPESFVKIELHLKSLVLFNKRCHQWKKQET